MSVKVAAQIDKGAAQEVERRFWSVDGERWAVMKEAEFCRRRLSG